MFRARIKVAAAGIVMVSVAIHEQGILAAQPVPAPASHAEAWAEARKTGLVLSATNIVRNSTGKPVQMTRDNKCLGRIGDEGWVEWDFKVATPGEYAIGFRYARVRSVGRPYSDWAITVDGKPVREDLAVVRMPCTGGSDWNVNDYKDYAINGGRKVVNLAKGSHVLRLRKVWEYSEALAQVVLSPVELPNVTPDEYLDDYEPPPGMVIERVDRKIRGEEADLSFLIKFRGASPLELSYTVSAESKDPAIKGLKIGTREITLKHDEEKSVVLSLTVPARDENRSHSVEILFQQKDLPVKRIYRIHARVPQDEPRKRPVVAQYLREGIKAPQGKVVVEPRSPEAINQLLAWRKDRKGPCPDDQLDRTLTAADKFLAVDLDTFIPCLPVCLDSPGQPEGIIHRRGTEGAKTCGIAPASYSITNAIPTDSVTSIPCLCGAVLTDPKPLAIWRGQRLKQFIMKGAYGAGDGLLTLGQAYEMTRDEKYAAKAREAFLIIAKRFPHYVVSAHWEDTTNKDLILVPEGTPHSHASRLGVNWGLHEACSLRESVVPAYDLVASSPSFTQADRDFVENNLLWSMDDDMLMEAGTSPVYGGKGKEHDLGGNQPNEGVGFFFLGMTLGDKSVMEYMAREIENLPDLTADGVPIQKLLAWAYTSSFYDIMDMAIFLKNGGMDISHNEILRKILMVFPLMGFRDGQWPQTGVGGAAYRHWSFYKCPKEMGLTPLGWISGPVYEGLKLGEELWGGEFTKLREYADARKKGEYPKDYRLPSVNFEKTGIAMMRGTTDNPMEVSFDYIRQMDAEPQSPLLTFFLYGNGDILSYIPIADDWPGGRYGDPYAWGYARGGFGTVCKNFVNLDERGGMLVPCDFVHWACYPDLKVICAKTAKEYRPGVNGERTMLLVNNYLVDFFRCTADKPHTMDWQFHSIGQMTLPAEVKLQTQDKPFVDIDKRGLGYSGGYEFFRQIRRGPAPGQVRAEWTVTPENRLQMFIGSAKDDELIACRMPMFCDKDEKVQHEPTRFTHDEERKGDHLVDALLHRVKTDRQVFAAVYEAYGKDGTTAKVKAMKVLTPEGLKAGTHAVIDVTHDGGTDIVGINYKGEMLTAGPVTTDARLFVVYGAQEKDRAAYFYGATKFVCGDLKLDFKEPTTQRVMLKALQ